MKRPVSKMCARRWVLTGVAAMAFQATTAWAAGESVRLDIRNTDVGAPLHCVLVLAHFVTLEAGGAGPGHGLAITFTRDPADGTLIYRGDDGRAMAVENVLCGVSGDWSDTRADVPILVLRDGTRSALAVDCVLDGRLRCRPGGS
jgi:hypothetical protein